MLMEARYIPSASMTKVNITFTPLIFRMVLHFRLTLQLGFAQMWSALIFALCLVVVNRPIT